MTSDSKPSTDLSLEQRTDLKRLAIQTSVGLVAFIIVLGILGYTFREELTGLSQGFVDTLGPIGILVGIFILDGLSCPGALDLFVAIAAMSGMSFWKAAALTSTAGVLAGTFGYGIGRLFRKTPAFKRFMARRGREVNYVMNRYGTVGVALAALTPLPYSIAAYAGGAGGMNFVRFVLVSLFRIPRIVGMLWLIQTGIVTGF